MTPLPRLSAKLYRRVSLILTEDAVLAEEVLARKKLATEIAGRLSDRVLDELKKMGQTPQVIGPNAVNTVA
jgi:uncharacterized protein YaiI (UPF0178 family)